ncbi:MAG: DNA-binding protein [Bacteroidetes bacterium]|nr:MAG: DNA-binding protein [Bacteroidota bacterium]
MKNEIILYQSNDLSEKLEVKIEEDTIWLTQAQIVTLFNSSKANISEHIKHIFQTKELEENSTVRIFRTVRKEGNRTVSRELIHYNLDMIISIGYRVNSIRGTQFRIWANKILKDYLLKGYSLNKRMNRIENNVHNLAQKVNEIDLQLKTNLPPNQGIYFSGQVFDAYTFVSDLIRSAGKSIILIDNYIDDTVFTLFNKRKNGVKTVMFTKNIGKQLLLDINKYNTQYEPIEVKIFKEAHDRFLILDEKDVYHFGASLKDLGKKWFAFSKMDILSVKVLEKLKDEGLL